MKNADLVGTGTRIVLVEDELLVAMDVEMQLASLGYDVVGTADTGSQALRVITEARPDMVLMDINLRGAMDGIAIASELQSRGINVPIVFVTAYGSDEALRRAQTVSFSGYLTKPYYSQQLQDVIHSALKQHGGERFVSLS